LALDQLLTALKKKTVQSQVQKEIPSPPQPGLYHYLLNPGQDEKVRLHLRVDSDNSGILSINASRIVHLNRSAVVMVYYILEEVQPQMAIKAVSKQYAIPRKVAQHDYSEVSQLISSLIHPDDLCPVHDLNIGIIAPFSETPSAPYRMDLAVTYRCQNNCHHCYNDRPRSFPELTTAKWKEIIDKIFNIGIPHIVFTGGEPTLRSDLLDLVCYAEGKGLITGLNTNGRLLSEPAYFQKLVDVGLDHVQITIESHDPAIHDKMVGAVGAWQQTVEGIKNALKSPLYVMTNTTMLKDNSPTLSDALDFLGNLGVPTIGLNALIYSGRGLLVDTGIPESELSGLLRIATQKTDYYQQRLIWYTPTQYCHFDPMDQNLGVKGCTAALYNMCIEPNGNVIPCQSYYQPVGNIFHESWDEIWNHDLCVSLRERRNINEVCRSCLLVNECGGGCPLSKQPYQSSPMALPDPIHAI
jgi:radical SAM protein with 4Fe4S-binding SPASM domain